jgi:FtsP/CotA-like multicopper oxidase with cupredoxin domain
MKSGNLLKQGALLLLLTLILQSAWAQDQPHMIEIGKRALILKDAKPGEFFKIPELRSENGVLELDLYIDEHTYSFMGDSVRLRTYTYRSGDKYSTKIGPWGPTLRIGRNDRLSMTVHNNLPIVDGDLDYLGSMNTSYAVDFDTIAVLDSNIVSAKALRDAIVDATISTLDVPNLYMAEIETIEEGKKWIVHGKVACQCPVGKSNTCVKTPVEYPVEYMWNTGTEEFALRVYQQHNEATHEDHNIPHGFNNTNMHTHGFHVSPNQDDIFRKVEPSFSSYYTYDLEDHTAGTMWYHPHVHGSTGLQVASGMSGAIIIEDGPLYPKYDDLALASDSAHERLMVFNQINYDTITGELTDFNTLQRSNYPQGTTVNGVSKPVMDIEPGEVQRWRILHSGYNSSLALEFPEEVKVYQIAIDGIMFNKPKEIESLHMAPGNRSDLIVHAPSNSAPGTFDIESVTYDMACEYFNAVDGGDAICKRTAANDTLESSIVQVRIGTEPLVDTMRVPTVLPGPGIGHSDIDTTELVNGYPRRARTTDFRIMTDTITNISSFEVDSMPFDGDVISQTLKLGDVERWKLSSDGNHPFHIHINPFQVVSYGNRQVYPPVWKDVAMASKDTIEVYTRYQKYAGGFVLHCHILSHEDEGMMQRVLIVDPAAGPPEIPTAAKVPTRTGTPKKPKGKGKRRK